MTQHRNVTIGAIGAALALILAWAQPVSAAAAAPRFLLASAPHGVVVRSAPAGPVIADLPGATPLGSPTWLWVVATARQGRWGRVVLPLRPNGRSGWIDLRTVRTEQTQVWVRASLRRRRIWLMRGLRSLASFSAGIGAPGTSTPVGRFSVTDRVLTGDPSGPFGWFAFGLSGHQPNLPPEWAGGDQLAIHGTDDPASIGTPASHGCLRVSAQALTRLRRTLELGMPVVIMPSARAAMRVARSSSVPRLPTRSRHPAITRSAPASPSPAIRVAATGLQGPVLSSSKPFTHALDTTMPAVAERRFHGPAHRPTTRTHASMVLAPIGGTSAPGRPRRPLPPSRETGRRPDRC